MILIRGEVLELGHRIRDSWLDTPIETLADLLRPDLRAVCVGLNPAPASVAAGHYYQGRLGQRFYSRLRQVGLLPEANDEWEDDVAFQQGIGFTDVVKRPTASATELTAVDYAFGVPLALQKIATFKPRLIVFTFKEAATRCLGQFDGVGFLDGRTWGRSEVFVMPGPYERSDRAAQYLETLRTLLH